jgi:hypothetical protein
MPKNEGDQEESSENSENIKSKTFNVEEKKSDKINTKLNKS